MTKVPKIGIGVIVKKDNKVLLGKRKGSHGEGSWSFPGGHLDFREGIFECAKREVLEETGLEVKNMDFLTCTNDIFQKEEKHYVTLYVKAEYDRGDLEVKEPDKCEEWDWFEWDDFPEPLFLPVENFLKIYN